MILRPGALLGERKESHGLETQLLKPLVIGQGTPRIIEAN